MHRLLTNALLATALLIFAGCQTNNSTEPNEEPVVAIAGGWTQAPISDPGVQTAAKEAVAIQTKNTKKVLTLEEILSAQTQVVAGTNYQLSLSVKESGKKKTASVVIWKKLDGTHDLSTWTWD